MALSIVILVFAALLLFAFTLRSRYGLPLFLMTLGMCVASVAVLLQSFNSSTYSPPPYFPMRALDLALYRYIGSFRIPLTWAQSIRCLGCLVFFCGIPVMSALVRRNLKQGSRRRPVLVILWAAAGLFMAAYALFYSPGTAYAIYLKYYSIAAVSQSAFRAWITRADLIMRAAVLIYILMPVFSLAFHYVRRNTTFFSDTFFLLTSILLLFDGIFYSVFFTGPFTQSVEALFRSGFWYLSNAVRVPVTFVLLFSVFSILIPIFILAAANHIFNGELVLLTRKRAMKNSIDELNRDLKDVFHSEKNLMFSIVILANEVKAAYGTEEGLSKLDRLTGIAQGRMEAITSSLNRIRELHLHAVPVDLRKLVDQAISGLAIPEDIRCDRQYCDFPVYCLVDEYHTVGALKNLFQNAVEALALSGREDKTITVTVGASKAWVSLSIRDNGTGIAHQELRRVMLPFVSSKSKNTNWGIGLPYAFRVVNAQLGQMRIRSSDQPGRQYTQVDILLPHERRLAA